MRSRRIAQHLKSQNWTAIVIDFCIVVLGVFLALQVQVWNQQRIERDAEWDYLERLSTDFAAIGERLARCLQVYARAVEAIEHVGGIIAAHVEAEPRPAPDRESFAASLIRLSAEDIPAGRSTTFVEMVSSGDLGILRDETLRNALVAYDERAQINRQIWQVANSEVVSRLGALYDHVDLRVSLDRAQYASIEGFDLPGMAADPEFARTLTILSALKANSYELCRDQRALAKQVRDRLGAVG